MSCEECEKRQEGPGIAYYRWKKANIGMLGCDEHLREIFNVLSEYQRRQENEHHA